MNASGGGGATWSQLNGRAHVPSTDATCRTHTQVRKYAVEVIRAGQQRKQTFRLFHAEMAKYSTLGGAVAVYAAGKESGGVGVAVEKEGADDGKASRESDTTQPVVVEIELITANICERAKGDAGEGVVEQVEVTADEREGAKGNAGETVLSQVEVATNGCEGAKGDGGKKVLLQEEAADGR